MDKKKAKKAVTILLILSCIISAYMLVAIPSPTIKSVHTLEKLDSLITSEILNAQIKPQQIRIQKFPIDSTFSRKMYRVKVPSRFSKTLFHFNIHNAFSHYGLEVPAKVTFPQRDMDIYVYNRNTIFSSIRLITDTSLDTLIIGVD